MANGSTVPLRSEIDDRYKWNAPSVFASVEAWKAACDALKGDLPALSALQGHLGDEPETLEQAVDLLEDLIVRAGRVVVYATMAHAVDMADQAANRMASQARGLYGQLQAAAAFIDPELLALDRDTLERWMRERPRLAMLRHDIDDLYRQQAHVRSPEVEELLGMLGDPFSGPAMTAGVLTNADFAFAPAIDSEGREIPVTQGTLGKILAGSDRAARRTAWEHYTDAYLAHKNTLASNLSTSIKQSVFEMRARRYESTLEASLFEANVPVEVYHNLIATFRKHLPTWHRYWAIRQRALGVDALQPYDVWAPLTQDKREVPYEQAVQWIGQGLAPMGEDYVRVLRRGATEERWVDVYPTQGKRAGAFSSGRPGTHPFIMISYNDNVLSMSTLAHELGHSMHSYLAWQHQPILYADYTLFAAEVASNFHQAMVRAHLLETQVEPAFQIEVIEEAMSNFYRYFLVMPTLARFELEIHQRAERGEGLTADDMNALMADLFSEAYGDGMQVDRERVGITWATFGHLYRDYYVYQYATGISGAHALAQRILSGEPGAVEDYLGFLKAGGSAYPLEALQRAGVDLTSSEPVEVTFGILSDLVDRLEELVSTREGSNEAT
jgi:oligoendopeptidase F